MTALYQKRTSAREVAAVADPLGRLRLVLLARDIWSLSLFLSLLRWNGVGGHVVLGPRQIASLSWTLRQWFRRMLGARGRRLQGPACLSADSKIGAKDDFQTQCHLFDRSSYELGVDLQRFATNVRGGGAAALAG